MNQKFTLMTCTYNKDFLLEEAIKHMLALEGLNELVKEIIIVDNASKDSTKDIVNKYMEKSSLIKYIYEPKQGVTYARKHAGDITTEWFIFVDDDNMLNSDYLIKVSKFLEENKRVGVLNCSAIATPLEGSFTDEQQLYLNSACGALACSHPSREYYKKGLPPIHKAPYGAGIVLLTEPIKKLANSGWTKNEGRKGDALTSGEDEEILQAVLDEGYESGMCTETFFNHIMLPNRLTKDYLSRLFSGLGNGDYLYFLSKSENGRIPAGKFMEYAAKLAVSYIIRPFLSSEEKRTVMYFNRFKWKEYLRCCLKGTRTAQYK